MKTLTSLLILISFSLLTFGQSRRDKIKTLKIAYITEKLNLSEQEAQQFWPIYNNFEQDYSKLKKDNYESRKNINFETISEEEAKQLLKVIRVNDNKIQSLESDFTDRLTKIMSAKKVILLRKIEDDFKRKMIEEYKKRRPE